MDVFKLGEPQPKKKKKRVYAFALNITVPTFPHDVATWTIREKVWKETEKVCSNVQIVGEINYRASGKSLCSQTRITYYRTVQQQLHTTSSWCLALHLRIVIIARCVLNHYTLAVLLGLYITTQFLVLVATSQWLYERPVPRNVSECVVHCMQTATQFQTYSWQCAM
jgi:hypothetical protein